MSIENAIFEKLGEFAVTVQFLVRAGWTFSVEPLYQSTAVILTKGTRVERCYDEASIEGLCAIAKASFANWRAMTTQQQQDYEKGYRDSRDGWKDPRHADCPMYIRGWEEAQTADES